MAAATATPRGRCIDRRIAPPAGCPAATLQTVYPLLIRPDPLPYDRQRWETPDGDFIDLDWLAAPGGAAAQHDAPPLLVLFHGLEGSSNSHYATHACWLLRRRSAGRRWR
jgi:predicted alpha/beta-fold hydrolase